MWEEPALEWVPSLRLEAASQQGLPGLSVLTARVAQYSPVHTQRVRMSEDHLLSLCAH